MTPMPLRCVVFTIVAGLMYSSQVHFLRNPIVHILVRKEEDEKKICCPQCYVTFHQVWPCGWPLVLLLHQSLGYNLIFVATISCQQLMIYEGLFTIPIGICIPIGFPHLKSIWAQAQMGFNSYCNSLKTGPDPAQFQSFFFKPGWISAWL